MKFDEFHVGQVIEAGPYVLAQDALLAFANDWDPQWFHTDPDAARAAGYADVVAFGKAYISNPDLVHRLRDDLPLNAWNSNRFYGGGADGYTDYPAVAHP